MHRILPFLLLLGFASSLSAQKMVHIPNYLQNPNDVNGAQFTWSKTAQSTNFILIWGNTVGTNPANYPDPDLNFNPSKILDTMEYIYTRFKEFEFLDDSPGTNLAQYKIPIVIYGTWGTNGAQGWANGGDADGIIGAFWVHPNAMDDGGVAAHELAHSLQAQNNIDYRNDHGLGNSWQNSGIFWECHANFMRNLLYPKAVTAWGMDVYHLETWGDWKNTYENYALLFAIMESEGIDMVNRLWRESFSYEYPLQAYKRLAGYSQSEFNDSLFHYARRMATYDFNYSTVGNYFRQYRNADLQNWLPTIQNVYSILRPVAGGDPGRYEIPIEQAPEEFSYNVIPLYPNADSCSVIVKFKGHTEANTHTGWRYGFVAALPNGKVSRYSPTYSANTGEIAFRLQGNETKMYLVVMGAPNDGITTNTTNDTWKGYPKHFRFPYEVNITGAMPEGYQAAANFRSQLRTNGHLHSNGGGWVQNSATVASSVYVAPTAIVRGSSNISGQVRIEGTAVVRNATMSGNVKVLGNAFVDGGTYSQNAKVQGNAFVVNAILSGNALVGMRARVDNYILSGTVEVGGDVVVYNDQGNCNNGVYYRLTNYYDNKLLECDNRTASHPANSDVNDSYNLFSNATMQPQCQCAGVNTVVVDSMDIAQPNCNNLSSGSVTFHIGNNCGPFTYAWSKGADSGTNLAGLVPGSYSFTITDGLDRKGVVPVEILGPPALSGTVSVNDYDCASTTGGTANLALSSGTAPFSYTWSNGGTTASLTNLPPDTYTVTTTDALGCTLTASTTIALSGQLNGSLFVTPIECTGNAGGGAISIANLGGNGPFDYQWSNGGSSASLNNLAVGIYALTATDAIGCTVTASAAITRNGQLEATLTATPIFCGSSAGGAVVVAPLSGTAPYAYAWANGETTATLTNLVPNTYAVTATDAYGCTFTGAAAVEASGQLGVELATTPITCYGESNGTASIIPNGGSAPYTWVWANGATENELANLGSGNYAVTVTDVLGCSGSLAFSLAAPDALSVQAITADVSCFGEADGSASLTVTGGTQGYSYLWSNQMTTASIAGLLPGNYTATVSDANGCTATNDLSITSPNALTLQLQAPSTLCPAQVGTVNALPSGGTMPYTYLWENAATNASISITGDGIYTVTITDANGCSATAWTAVFPGEDLVLSSTQNDILCHGGENGLAAVKPLTGNAPYSWGWNTGATDSLLTSLGAGSYFVTVSDAVGCTQVAQFTFLAPPPIVLETTAQAVSCYGEVDGAASAFAEGGTPSYTYIWSNGQTTDMMSDLSSGIYAVTITDANGCSATASIAIDSPDALALTLDAPDLICPNTTTNIAAMLTGGTFPFTYQWNTGASDSVLVVEPGFYTLLVTDANDCTLFQSVQVLEAYPVTLIASDIIPANSATTDDGAVSVDFTNGVPPFTFLWSNGSTEQNLIGVLPGDYTLTVTDAVGCEWTFDFTVDFDVSAVVNNQTSYHAIIAPNPSTSHAALRLELSHSQAMMVTVSDAVGRVLQTDKALFQSGKNSFALPQGLAAGIYWVTVKDMDGKALVLQWVVQ